VNEEYQYKVEYSVEDKCWIANLTLAIKGVGYGKTHYDSVIAANRNIEMSIQDHINKGEND